MLCQIVYVPFSISIFLQFYHFRVERNRRQENGDDIIQVMGLRLEVHEKDAEFDENGVPEVLAGVDHIIRIFGKNFVDSMVVTFTDRKSNSERTCQFPKNGLEFTVSRCRYL